MTKFPSYFFIVLFNLMPLYGMYYWDWSVFEVVFIYWIENIIIGVFHFLHLLICRQATPIFAVFFILHYGIFTLGHGFFVFVLFGGTVAQQGAFDSFSLFYDFIIVQQHYNIAVLSFILMHLFKKIESITLYGRELKGIEGGAMGPYGRIVILHVTIIFSGMLITILRLDSAGIILLVFFKIAYDIYMYKRDAKKHLVQPTVGKPDENGDVWKTM